MNRPIYVGASLRPWTPIPVAGTRLPETDEVWPAWKRWAFYAAIFAVGVAFWAYGLRVLFAIFVAMRGLM